ncbi:hypothetical protein CC79DRAFT_1367330 [Sarocladium strictum]
MKFSSALVLAVAAVADAHYTFGRLVYDGTTYNEWEYVRRTLNEYSNGPTDGVANNQIRCYEKTPGDTSTKTLAVTAGSKIGFKAGNVIGHPGPAAFYMAKVPSGQTAKTWSGEGAVWFKIWEEETQFTSAGPKWPVSQDATEIDVNIPSCLSSGEYLLRIEHLGLHGASTVGGAQFYVACAQIDVSGGGSFTPSTNSLVSFPGAYSPNDPGILFQLYWPVPTSYVNPGPDPISC